MFGTDKTFRNASIGGLVWVTICIAPLPPNLGIGTIEKLFLLAPLVIVPLGLGLLGVYAPPLVAAMIVFSFFFPKGPVAGALVVPWLIFVTLAGYGGLRRLVRGDATEFCFGAALLCLPVGGVGLLQSRFGMTPLGFREPLVLLVAVHFHYAAFVSPILAGAVLRRTKHLAWPVAICASVGSPILAAGYVLHVPSVRLLGATVLVVALCGVSLLTLAAQRNVLSRPAQLLLALSATSVIVAMAYAGVYALADFVGEVWVAIPHMARTHGVINALGFSVCGLVGWTLANGRRETNAANA
jgi:hypothetical protein